jgi:hypothetical protein
MAISGKNPCWKCNKEIVNVRFEIEIIDGGKPRLSDSPAADESDPGYMGWHPVGSDCAGKLRAAGVDVRFIG